MEYWISNEGAGVLLKQYIKRSMVSFILVLLILAVFVARAGQQFGAGGTLLFAVIAGLVAAFAWRSIRKQGLRTIGSYFIKVEQYRVVIHSGAKKDTVLRYDDIASIDQSDPAYVVFQRKSSGSVRILRQVERLGELMEIIRGGMEGNLPRLEDPDAAEPAAEEPRDPSGESGEE